MTNTKVYLLLAFGLFAVRVVAQTRRAAVPKADTIVVYDTVVQTVMVRIYRAPTRPRLLAALAPLPAVSGNPVASLTNPRQHSMYFLSPSTATFCKSCIIESNKKLHAHKVETMKKRHFLSLAFLALAATPSLHGQRFIISSGVGYGRTADARLPTNTFPYLRLGWGGERGELTAGLQIAYHAVVLPQIPEVNLMYYRDYYYVENFQTDVSWLHRLGTFGPVRLLGGGGVVWSRSTVNTLANYTLKPQTEIVHSALFQSVTHNPIGGVFKAAVDFRLTRWLHLNATSGYIWLPGSPTAATNRHLEDLIFVQAGLKLALGRK
jgi:hypothetical protein